MVAVEHADRNDNDSINVHAHMELAHVLAARGLRDRAAAEGRKGLALYESKGDQPGMAQARAFLDQLRGAPG